MVREWHASGDRRDLLLSEPHISGDMYGSHQDFRQNLTLLQELFPQATIIFFVRNQADWLQSAYRQQLVKDPGRPIEVFLNWYDGDFRPRAGRWAHGVRNVEALNLRFLEIYRAYARAYGTENVYLLQQEDLKERPTAVKHRLAEALGVAALPSPPRERRQNRSYSALAIALFYPGVHRHFPRPQSSDAGRPSYRIRRLTGHLRRLRRILIQHGFDKLIYKDWDLLQRHGMRARLDEHYRDENAELNRIAGIILEHGPGAVPSQSREAAPTPGTATAGGAQQ
ncbi:MAG: sulfotransferase [Arhodomonas sp.]|nr:sulfotransferase [Arhodomonas sp.]